MVSGSLARLVKEISFVTWSRGFRISDHIHKRAMIVESCVIIIIVALFNFYHQWLTIVLADGELAGSVPLMAGFGSALPLLNLWLGLALVINAFHLHAGQRNRVTRWAGLGISTLAVIVLVLIVSGDPIFSLNPEWVANRTAAGYSLIHVEKQLVPLLNVILKLFLALAALVMFLVSAARISRLAWLETKRNRDRAGEAVFG